MYIVILSVTILTNIFPAFGTNILFLNGVGSPSHHLWWDQGKYIESAIYQSTIFQESSLNRRISKKSGLQHHSSLSKLWSTKTVQCSLHPFRENLRCDVQWKKSCQLFEKSWTDRSCGYRFIWRCQFSCMWWLEENLKIFRNSNSKFIFSGVLQSQGLDTLLGYPSDFKFDLVIYDFIFGPCLIPFLHKFKYPPLIGVSAFNIPSIKRGLIGGHIYPAYGELRNSR